MTGENIEKVVVGMVDTNCWIYPLYDEGRPESCIVIDPGDHAPAIISRLKELDLVPAYILLSHGHFDHLAGLPDLLEAFDGGVFSSYPKPKTGIQRLDSHYLGEKALIAHRESFIAVGGDPAYIEGLLKPLPSPDLLLEEGDKVGPLRVLHVPGHSPGSAAFYDEDRRILFSGDTLFKGTWGRTDLPGGSEEEIYKSLERLLAMDADIRVFPGHGPATSIETEKGLVS